MKLSGYIILLGVCLISCKWPAGAREAVKVRIKSENQSEVTVQFREASLLDNTPLFESQTDSTGYVVMDLPLQEPMFLNVQIGNKYGEVYLSPGDDVMIKEVGLDYTIPLQFSGPGADINNYISWVNSNVEGLKWRKENGIYDLSDEQFITWMDSARVVVDQFHQAYLDSVPLSEEFIKMLAQKNEIKFLAIDQEFKSLKANKAFNQYSTMAESGQVPDEMDSDVTVESFELLFNPELMEKGYWDYYALLNFYWMRNIRLTVARELVVSKKYKLAPIMSYALIESADYPLPIKEFFKALDLSFWLNIDGVTQQTDSLTKDFRNKHPNSPFLSSVNNTYREWLTLAAGKPAPEISGFTIDGKSKSLRDFRGKLIYVDVWATWCGPCIDEISASKQLQQVFFREANIEFLNVSIDRDVSAWKAFLTNEREWKGTHIHLEPEDGQRLMDAYKLPGIPGYFLIDQSGNILTVRALRPSDENLQKEIRQILSRGL